MSTILEELRKINMMEYTNGSNQADKKDSKDACQEAPALKGRYRCRVCGYIYDEAEEGKPFSTLTQCPLCHVGPEAFMQIR